MQQYADSRPTNLTTTPAPAHHNTTVLFIIIIIVGVTISSSNVGEVNVKRALHPIRNVLWIWLARYQYGSRYPANTDYAVGSISYCLLVPTFLIQEPVVYYVSALRKPDIFIAYKVKVWYHTSISVLGTELSSFLAIAYEVPQQSTQRFATPYRHKKHKE